MNATEQKLFRLRDLANRLQRLRAIDAEVCKAADAALIAIIRQQDARNRYARLHAEIVSAYGEHNAPPWIEAIHGKRTRT